MHWFHSCARAPIWSPETAAGVPPPSLWVAATVVPERTRTCTRTAAAATSLLPALAAAAAPGAGRLHCPPPSARGRRAQPRQPLLPHARCRLAAFCCYFVLLLLGYSNIQLL